MWRRRVAKFLPRLADYECPKYVHLVSDIPKEPTGKLLKRELTRLFVQQQIQPTLSVLAQSTRDTGYVSVFPNAANFFVDLHSSLNIIVALV